MVAVLISALLKCRYCLLSHAHMMCTLGGDAAKSEALAVKQDFRKAGLGPDDEAMLEYAEKVTLAPHAVTEADVGKLRAHGFSDIEILELATLAAYRNFVARFANALGVVADDAPFDDDPEMRERISEGTV